MKSLWHNGILIPESYQPKSYKIKYKDVEFKSDPKLEERLVAWVKKLGTEYVKDPVFVSNFWNDFSKIFKDTISSPDELDLSMIITALNEEKVFKESLDKETKKRLTAERKLVREQRKEKYGYAMIDGVKTEIAAYMAEPSSIFMGRGKHPRRGCWKEGPKVEDIEYNQSPDSPNHFKNEVWHPNDMWVARWKDKFSDKIKYVWLSDSSNVKQKKEIAKFDKASRLGSRLMDIRMHVMKGGTDKEEKIRKIATVCYLIDLLNIRVGDEKDPDEADTIGATTLRKEHVKLMGNNTISIEFLGKDSVLFRAETCIEHVFYKNLEEFETKRDLIFEGVISEDVSKFLSEVLDGCTAKLFRTWKATKEVKDFLLEYPMKKTSPDFEKIHCAKESNLKAAMICNHKKKLAAKYAEILEKKRNKMFILEKKVEEASGQDLESLKEQLRKAELSYFLAKDSGEYNLGTSLKSYIDPRAYVDWANKVDFDLTKFYNAALCKKYSWALEKEKEKDF